MASENESGDITEDKIDNLKLREAVTLCKKHGIELSREIKLHQMKWLLKSRLLCRDSKRNDIIDSLDWDAYVDENRRKALVEIYNNTIDNAEHIMMMVDPVVSELKKIFPNVCNMLDSEKQNITESKAPILVLGETGSGKSSFINLLLGCDILPCSLLSNTHVICEIRSSKDTSSYAILHHCADDELTKIPHRDNSCEGLSDGKENDYEGFKAELGECIQAVDETGQPVYKRAQIYIASDILKWGLMIVDSPGIGEAKSMESVVLEYILSACTFIYIIDSTSAGGMQDRMQKLVRKVRKKALDEQREYRPESAIFILNKWDGVPYNERAEVWDDTVRKIKGCWPDCQESQIFKFSTLEATYIQDKGGMSPKFQPILGQISQLIPLGREILVLRGYKFLDDFASKCIHCFGAHLMQIKLTAEEREEMRTETKDRLHTLKTKIDSFFHDQFTHLEQAIKAIAKDLGEYIKRPENMAKVCKFSHSEIPHKKVWKEMAVAVRSHVYEKIMKMIKTWEEEEEKFKMIGEMIASSIEEQFPKFQAEIFDLQRKMSSSIRVNSDGVLEEEEEATLIPGFLRRRLEGMSFGKRTVIVVGLAPVMLVGMAVNLPVFGFKTLKRSVTTLIHESDFARAQTQDQKIELCEKYAKTTVASITDRIGLVKIIEEDIQPVFQYLRQQRQRMEAQIQSDLDLLQTLKIEERDDDDISRTYEPLNAKFEILCRRLRHFLFINLPDQFSPSTSEISYQQLVMFSDKVVCSGFAAEIFQGKSKQRALTDNCEAISVRKSKEPIQPSTVKKYIIAQQAYSTIRQESIVRCFGVSTYEGALYQVLEPLQCNLRCHLVAREEELRVNKANTVLGIMKDVVAGLKFLHEREKHFVSLDLSMDTVAVDANGTIKLTNISVERRVLLKPDYDSGKITVGKFVHFHPRFFGYTTQTIPKARLTPVSGSQSLNKSMNDKKQRAAAAEKKHLAETIYRRVPDERKQQPVETVNSSRSVSDSQQQQTQDNDNDKATASALTSSAELSQSFSGKIPSRKTSQESLQSSGDHSKGSGSTKSRKKSSNLGKQLSGSTDSTVTARTQHMYTTKDDMYAVGIMMWELWEERPLKSQTLEYAIPNDAVTAHKEAEPYVACEIMEKFMRKFQPKLEPPFDVSDRDGPDGAFVEEWWSSLKRCLEQKMSSNEWLELWEQFGTYPSVTLVFSDRHFSTTPVPNAAGIDNQFGST